MHLNSKLLFEKYGTNHFLDGIKVLEIGPSGFPSIYRQIVNNDKCTWHTMDFEDSTYIGSANNKLTYVLTDPYTFPVDSESYDIVISGQVIEHVGKIWVWLAEIKRILKKGGLVITINPVSWPYHEAPIDCWRIFPDGIRALASDCNLRLVECVSESLEMTLFSEKDRASEFILGQSSFQSYTPSKLNALIFWNKIVRNIPFIRNYLLVKFEVSVDTISILRKTE